MGKGIEDDRARTSTSKEALEVELCCERREAQAGARLEPRLRLGEATCNRRTKGATFLRLFSRRKAHEALTYCKQDPSTHIYPPKSQSHLRFSVWGGGRRKGRKKKAKKEETETLKSQTSEPFGAAESLKPAPDLKYERGDMREAAPEISGPFLAYFAFGLLLFSIFYNVLFLAIIKPSVDGPDSVPSTTTTDVNEAPRALDLEKGLPMPEVLIQP